MKIEIATENLDVMTPEELEVVIGFIDCSIKGLTTLRYYAKEKKAAIALRTIGMISDAMKLEDFADALYLDLPESLRW
jgi:hypothetical protein